MDLTGTISLCGLVSKRSLGMDPKVKNLWVWIYKEFLSVDSTVNMDVVLAALWAEATSAIAATKNVSFCSLVHQQQVRAETENIVGATMKGRRGHDTSVAGEPSY